MQPRQLACEIEAQTVAGNIFAHRAASVQVSYLAYPGTLGAPYIDYILADRMVIPEGEEKHYDEKIAWLPHSYQVNDDKRVIAEKPSRAEAGLPPAGFVFCNFNHANKFTPSCFTRWMRILEQVPGSILWLLAPDPIAWEPARRADLERIYPQGCEARECEGLLEGRGRSAEGEERFLGIVGEKPLAAQRAWRFADLAWRDEGGGTLRVLLDCASHATRLEEERIVLTEFIVDMSLALENLARRGTRVLLTIAGKAGGGVYVALAAPARHVAAVHGAQIHVLPGAAVTAILGSSRDAIPSFADYHRAHVAEEELKLGLVPDR